jgi:CelD/BcsL family acetyltransferase involved in cellulose biosynthesis
MRDETMSAIRAADSEQSQLGPRLVEPRGSGNRALVAVEQLRPEWEALAGNTPMESYIWARACAEAFACEGFRIVRAGESQPRALAAFVTAPNPNTLVPLGAELYEPSEFACADASAAQELSEAIAALGTNILIRDMRADSIMVENLRRAAGGRLVTQPRPGHPWLELDDSWLEPESHLNAGRRSDLRRAMRNAAKVGTVQCEIVTPRPAELAGLLGDAFLVESAGWKGSQGSALAIDPRVGGFYRKFAQAACQLGTLRIGLLRVGERAAAMQLAVENNGCFWLFKMGYDEAFARFSPGTLLMAESLRSARQRGCQRYEMMGESEPWNQIWTGQLHPAVSLRLYPASPRGWVNAIGRRARAAVKSWLRAPARESE